MANKPTKQQVAYGKARAGGQGAYKITAKEVKRTAKGVAKAAGLAATIVGPGKVVKAVKIARNVKKASEAGKSAAKSYKPAIDKAVKREIGKGLSKSQREANKAKGNVKMLNPKKKTMGQISKEVASRTKKS